jgi:nucleoid-associated protein YgaU
MFAKTLLIAFALALAVAVSARTSDSAGPEQRYVVKRYDTLWSIATSHYAGDPREAVWKIEQRNDLPGATITPGQVLRLP